MPAPHPKEFRDDVVALARKGETPMGRTESSARRAAPASMS